MLLFDIIHCIHILYIRACTVCMYVCVLLLFFFPLRPFPFSDPFIHAKLTLSYIIIVISLFSPTNILYTNCSGLVILGNRFYSIIYDRFCITYMIKGVLNLIFQTTLFVYLYVVFFFWFFYIAQSVRFFNTFFYILLKRKLQI